MRARLILFLIISTTCLSNAQNQAPAWEWAKGHGIQPAAIKSDFNNNVFIAGYFLDTITVGNQTLIPYGGSDAVLAKFNDKGVFLWLRQMGGTGGAGVSDMVVDSKGGACLVGIFNSKQFTVSPSVILFHSDQIMPPSHNNWDGFIVRFDSSGNHDWSRVITGKRYSYVSVTGICVDDADRICAYGSFKDTLRFGQQILEQNNSGLHQTFLVGLNLSGAVLWTRTFTAGNGSGSANVVADKNGNILCNGFFSGTLIAGTVTLSSSSTGTSMFTMKLNLYGIPLWARAIYWTGYTNLSALTTDYAGSVILTSKISGNVTIAITTYTNLNQDNSLIAKYNSSGSLLWSYLIGGRYTNSLARSVTTDAANHVYFAGDYYNDTLFLNGNPVFISGDPLGSVVAKLDPNGMPQWFKRVPGINTTFGGITNVSNKGDLYFSCLGYGDSFYDNDTLKCDSHLWSLAKMHVFTPPPATLTSLAENTSEKFHIYPVPANDVVFLKFSSPTTRAKINVYDCVGKLVCSQVTTEKDHCTISVGYFPAGFYFAELSTGTERSVQKFFVIR